MEFHPESRALYDAALPRAVRERVELRIGDFSRMDLDGAFDCVVACEVLEHVPDDDAFAARLAGCLRPGGQLLLSVPAHMRFWSPHEKTTQPRAELIYIASPSSNHRGARYQPVR